jgi:hypothetical protein
MLMFLALGCSDSSPSGPSTLIEVEFQDGVYPHPAYYGTRDAIMKNSDSSDISNGNFGPEPLDTLGMVETGGELFERRLIIRMDISETSGCAAVHEATITLTIIPVTGDTLILETYEALEPARRDGWDEGTGGVGGGVSWSTYDGSNAWDVPGGSIGAVPVSTDTIAADSVVIIAVPNDLAFRWIREPWTNHGLIIKSVTTQRETFRIVQMRESASPASRPRFFLSYEKGG